MEEILSGKVEREGTEKSKGRKNAFRATRSRKGNWIIHVVRGK